jgi:hypothetical protein
MERMAWRSAMKCERGVLCEKGAVAGTGSVSCNSVFFYIYAAF